MARMAADDGLPSRTICTVLGSSQVDCSAEASPSALVEDTSLYDTRHAVRSASESSTADSSTRWCLHVML